MSIYLPVLTTIAILLSQIVLISSTMFPVAASRPDRAVRPIMEGSRPSSNDKGSHGVVVKWCLGVLWQ